MWDSVNNLSHSSSWPALVPSPAAPCSSSHPPPHHTVLLITLFSFPGPPLPCFPPSPPLAHHTLLPFPAASPAARSSLPVRTAPPMQSTTWPACSYSAQRCGFSLRGETAWRFHTGNLDGWGRLRQGCMSHSDMQASSMPIFSFSCFNDAVLVALSAACGPLGQINTDLMYG